MKTFDECITWLETVPLYGHKDGLNNMFRLMDELGSPHLKLKVIHVAGTNGKGSCSAMLHRILMTAGYRVGLYTSPHLVDYRERIRLDDQMISKEDFAELFLKVVQANDHLVSQGHPHATFFEFLTATAFLYFSRCHVDYVILEVGVGGRLDATNIVANPVVSLITSISLDHTKVLGDTKELIAQEKAGIIKAGRPVVAAPNDDSVLKVLREISADRHARFYTTEALQLKVLEALPYGSRISIGEADPELPEEVELPMIGGYQIENLAAVLQTVQVLRKEGALIRSEEIVRGIRKVKWPGRMQLEVLEDHEILMEGAHNPDGAKWLGRYIAGLTEDVVLVFSALAKKDFRQVLKSILKGGHIERILFAPIKDETPLLEDDFKAGLEELKVELPVTCFGSIPEMMDHAMTLENPRILCSGSLYLVGEIMEWLAERRDEEHV